MLAVLSAGIGDFILAVPAIRALRRAFPRARLTLLVSSKTFGYASLCPWADGAVVLDGASLGSPVSWPGLVRRLAALRRCRYDLALSLYEISSFPGMVKLYALFKLLGAARTAGRNTCGRGFFFETRIPETYASPLHQADYYAQLVRSVGGGAASPAADDLWTTPAAELAVRDYLAGLGLPPGTPLIGVNPGGARASRRWAPEKFAEAADLLSGKYGAAVVVVGGPGEERLAEEVAARMRKKPAVCAGRFDFAGSVSLLKRLRLLITTHSSLMHAANSLGTPHVALIGMSDPVRDGPYRPDPSRSAVVGAALPGDPAPRDDALYSSSMAAITAGQVVAAAERLLGRPGAAL